MNLESLRRELMTLDANEPQFATLAVDRLLSAAHEAQASDLHLLPMADGLDVRWRIDGVLEGLAVLPARVSSNVIARLKVLAGLLTYRTDVPQEGRIRETAGNEVRVSTFPTLYGEKAVVRLFADRGPYVALDALGLRPELIGELRRLLTETSGAILVTGPAGSGKTTTLYACLSEIGRRSEGRRSLASLEDPIEMAVPGVAQTQVNAAAGFDLAAGLRFLLRQDPEVIMVGEIRDRATAETVFQASLTGHLVISSFHAASAAGAVSRLSDMEIAPYLLRSGILAIISQRLVRRLCECAQTVEAADLRLGLPIKEMSIPAGCADCRGTGYRGRVALAEMLVIQGNELARTILSRGDRARLEQLAIEAGMVPLFRRACEAVEAHLTTPAEVRRVLGFGEPA
ncbi:MAG TPA: GspE/PulE family protein [Pirellulales bacterium]|nr:GspE/PulE family protein [Pirellulales bacterium]